jgi:nitric oxide reductase large subunit
MNSESIVVIILVALAVGFIIWVRRNSRDHERVDQPGGGEGNEPRSGDLR